MVLSPFAALAKIAKNSGMEPRAFLVKVSEHIDALQAWEARRALRNTAKPGRSECDSDATFQSALEFWQEAQSVSSTPNPAPSAPIVIERAIAVHTAENGSRTYSYIGDEWGASVFRDPIIQSNKRREAE